MNKIPGVNEVLALVDRLKALVQDFSAREDKLESDLRARTAAETRAFQRGSEELAVTQQGRVRNFDVEFENRLQRCHSTFERRKIRINQAHKTLRRSAGEAVTEFEGRRKHKLQQNAIEAERRRDADLAANIASVKEFKEKLNQARDHDFLLIERSARGAFRGYASFRRLLSRSRKWPDPDLSGEHLKLHEEMERLRQKTETNLQRFRKQPIPAIFRWLPPWLLLLILLAGFAVSVPALRYFGITSLSYRETGLITGGIFVFLFALHWYGRTSAKAAAATIASDLARARRLNDVAYEKVEIHGAKEEQRIKADFAQTTVNLDQEYKQVIKDAINLRDQRPRQVDEKAGRVAQRNERLHKLQLEQLEQRRIRESASLKELNEENARRFADEHNGRMAKFEADHRSEWQALETEWKGAMLPLCAEIETIKKEAAEIFPDWQLSRWKDWTPPKDFKNAAKFGELEIDLEKFAEVQVGGSRLPIPCSSKVSVPLCLVYPNAGSILFETKNSGGEEAVASINDIIFRLLSTTPPGKLSFTIFDPVGLGQSFAGLMHLADYEDSHINSRIWTQTTQIEEKLAELNEHMEKVIQMYLRNEYQTIAEYNAQAGSIAEKYHFLVVASFPVNFSETAAQRLRNIAASGARCGVYTLIHWDQRHATPQAFVPDELRKNSVCIVHTDRGFEIAGRRMPGTNIALETPPSPEFATEFLHEVGKFSKDSNRVEVPFEQIAPQDGQIWSEETTEELTVPIGRSGATKWQKLAIGKGTRQHALIAGKTGSGKSTLFHVMITNLALWCSPEQVEFYLVDFKKGVEFKCYATRRLPHARVVAIESDRQFGLSVLERVDAELRRRGDLFRKLGVQDIPGYKRAGGTEQMPRSLLMIDEFQEFFTEEDRISQGAAVLLDRIVRQGRAFGIHVILGSQTLGGAYTLARATLGQMVIRIALQCNEADAYLIMDQDNPAPRLLSRPGEGIYNDAAGALEGNSPFQAVWLPEDVRDRYLAKTRELADQSGQRWPGPFVFEGNAPAEVRENLVLAALLKSGAAAPPSSARIWLGSPNSIKGPTEAVFQRQSGNNLMVVGQSEEPTLAMLAVSLISLAAQYPPGTARLILLESTTPGSPAADFLDRVIQSIPHQIARPKVGNLGEVMGGLSEELQRLSAGEQGEDNPTTFLIIHGLENFKKLRQEDEFAFSSGSSDAGPNPAAVLQTLITEGPNHGFHVFLTCDTFNNISRFLGRKALSEFATRVLFQMSASDSASLIDAPDASTLGLHRALLYNDREGYMETFRPYARPGNDWLDEVAAQLKRVVQVSA